MNIKKSIAGSLFSMLLVSEMAAADWGDVYYCQMTNNIEITLVGKVENYKLEKFQFKLDQTKNAMVFGSTGMFKNEVFELTTGMYWPSLETWDANGKYSMTYFAKGKFLFTQNAMYATIVSANCDKF